LNAEQFFMATSHLNKTCLICGNKKPLAAFLQMTGAQGSLYGDVCSSCRGPGAQLDEKISLLEDDQDTTSSGLAIDSSARNLAELQDKKRKKDRTESDRQELIKRDKLSDEKEDKIDVKEKAEKDHRTNFIDAKKKQTFLSFQDKKTALGTQAPIKKAVETRTMIEHRQKAIDTANREATFKEELRINTPDLSDPLMKLDKVGFQTANFHNYTKFLGGVSATVRRIEQLAKTTEAISKSSKQEKPSAAKDKDAPTDFTKNNFPSSRRR
jgi:hypothetical protein